MRGYQNIRNFCDDECALYELPKKSYKYKILNFFLNFCANAHKSAFFLSPTADIMHPKISH